MHLMNTPKESPIYSTKINVSFNIQIKTSEVNWFLVLGRNASTVIALVIGKSVERSMYVCNSSLNIEHRSIRAAEQMLNVKPSK